MTIKNKMIDEQIEEATQLRYQGVSWANIARKQGLHWQTVRDTLFPDYAAARKAKKHQRRVAAKQGVVLVSNRRLHDDMNFSKPGEDLLYARDQRLAIQYTDFTSEHFGDPRPGFSQLDKKRAQGLWK